MTETIRKFYAVFNLPTVLLNEKLARFERNKDIAAEFVQWTKTGKYIPADICVEVEGYTAEKLAGMSKYLDGDGAFEILIELRENIEKALHRIASGFKMK